MRPAAAPLAPRLCGCWASHVDHVVTLKALGLPHRNGSTKAWRKVREFVLRRDAYRCQLPVDGAGNYDAAADPMPQTWPAHPDQPDNLRAACALHNLQRGGGEPAATAARRKAKTWTW